MTKRLFSIPLIAGLSPFVSLWAELAPPNEAGVSVGQWHMNVRSVEESKKFWTTLGGTAIRIDGVDVIKLPGIFIFLKKGSPAPGGNYGSTLNHVAFLVPDTEAALTKWKAAGLTTEFVKHALGEGGARLGYVYTPDDLKIRLNTDKSVTTPVANPLVMFWVKKVSVPEVEAWYVKTFGGKLGGNKILNGVSIAGIPGGRLNVVSSADNPTSRTPAAVGLVKGAVPDEALFAKLVKPGFMRPSKGRTLDYIGFEIRDLEKFCEKLAADGIKFDQPYSTKRHKSFASAMITDPWGTSIELTEGLRKF
jgi:catechol 2,3-dioxygenase-like lactoylglutathione lyase family enzyme